jgi:glucokinase
MRNKLAPDTSVEEVVGGLGIKKTYAVLAGIGIDEAPEAEGIEDIVFGKQPGDIRAAKRAFEMLGEVAGDAAASVLTLVDGLLVIGGGIANAAPLFMPALMRELSSSIMHVSGDKVPRIEAAPYWLDDPAGLAGFLGCEARELAIPGSGNTIVYDAKKRTGVGVSRLGTGKAVALGSYIFAVDRLSGRISDVSY